MYSQRLCRILICQLKISFHICIYIDSMSHEQIHTEPKSRFVGNWYTRRGQRRNRCFCQASHTMIILLIHVQLHIPSLCLLTKMKTYKRLRNTHDKTTSHYQKHTHSKTHRHTDTRTHTQTYKWSGLQLAFTLLIDETDWFFAMSTKLYIFYFSPELWQAVNPNVWGFRVRTFLKVMKADRFS